MKRLSYFALAVLAAFSLTAQDCLAFEQESPPLVESCWNWGNLVCDNTKALVCPCGGGSYIYAHIVGKYGIPEEGATVTATFEASPDVALCESVSGVTDENGDATLHVCAGLNVTGGTACLAVTTTVIATLPDEYWEEIRWCPECPNDDPFDPACRGVDEREWLSPDMNADLSVDAADYSIFASDWLENACRSDFNCNGRVDAPDWSLFAPHYLHSCSNCSE